ncbi:MULTISPECIES: acylneuraminate cytidylyltransferase family protein [Paenibacillus]|uniref:acylneuraminate cytidylyltransferase family protein n=1 Tax=Paenibacillus TaxID=44249 RepID=UPI00096C2AEA|nr:acylneuraminate cytidylyltransferase family protein [Paenibacillus odorifer]OMD62770.1 acylneuraminate cytidylyltransferase [Paenibacillus odorifer]
MIKNKKILAIIPARGGSKGLPRKNIRELAGKPLIAWTIEAGRKSKYIDRLIVSTEDSEIIEVAKEYGAEIPFVRPKHLAEDESLGLDPVFHALGELPGYDIVVLLQPTSPLRLTEDIDACIEQLIVSGGPACVSMTETEILPYWMYTLQDSGLMKPIITKKEIGIRRQDLPPVYILNGAVYVAEIEWLFRAKSFITEETSAFIMPNSRSYDIDTEEDFLLCEWKMNKD